MAPPVQTPVPLFPPAPTLKFAEDSKLQGAVKNAIDKLTSARGGKAPVFRLAIIDLGDESPSSTLKYGAYDGDTIDFIASEAKLIALYAAFALRDMVERFSAALKGFAALQKTAQALGGPKAPPELDLFQALRTLMDPAILDAADSRLAHIPRALRLPNYRAIFTVPPGGTPHFNGHFINSLFKMIVPSDNNAASAVITAVGFAYISGAMQAANLLVNGKGPWLTADFAGNYYPLMDSANDNMVGQAGTALSMAKLMAIIVTGATHLGGNSFKAMKTLLHDAVDGPDTPFLTRSPPHFNDPSDTDPTKTPLRIPRSKITHIKLGLADLKARNGGNSVGSEVWRLQGLNKPDKVYAIAWQNLNWRFTSPEDLAFAIWHAIEHYEA